MLGAGKVAHPQIEIDPVGLIRQIRDDTTVRGGPREVMAEPPVARERPEAIKADDS
jgi:hypothetical protein